MSEWIKCSDRLPEVGVTVLVYSPPTKDSWPDEVNINFDYIDPDCDEPIFWFYHGQSYEHFCCVAKPEGSTGPSESAPYTHWMSLPEVP